MFVNIPITTSIQVDIESPKLPADGMSCQPHESKNGIHISVFAEGYSPYSSTVEPMESHQATFFSAPLVGKTNLRPPLVKPTLFSRYKQSSRKHSAKVGLYPLKVHMIRADSP